MSPAARADEPILTLEPLVAAVRAGLEDAGWSLSGLQKTTSHEFEGRWKGESTRSAYLFFHREHRDEPVSIDVYIDETSRGLTGNLALAVDLLDLGDQAAIPQLFSDLRDVCVAHLPETYRTPVSLRFRLRDTSTAIEDAEGEVRFKLVIPKSALDRGRSAVEDLAGVSATAFEALLEEPRLKAVMIDS